MNSKFFTYFCNKKFSGNNFGAKIEASVSRQVPHEDSEPCRGGERTGSPAA